MPVVLRVHGYKFWFYMADIVEPPHVHIGKDGNEAKFWLNPVKISVKAGSARLIYVKLNALSRQP
jgi:hypothetical protein